VGGHVNERDPSRSGDLEEGGEPRRGCARSDEELFDRGVRGQGGFDQPDPIDEEPPGLGTVAAIV
jgi:hypothetical protein